MKTEIKLPASKLVKYQQIKRVFEGFRVEGGYGKLVVNIRYDDSCGNGHNSFSITGTLYGDDVELSSGCIHDDIIEFAPELEYLIKWHLCSSDGPIHYLANTLYHARDTDHDGLRVGEYKAYNLNVISSAVIKGESTVIYSSDTIYSNKQNNPNFAKIEKRELLKLNDFKSKTLIDCEVVRVNQEWSKSEGKPVDIDAARRSAIWPNATIEQLSSREQLEQHLPELMHEFKGIIESLGMEY